MVITDLTNIRNSELLSRFYLKARNIVNFVAQWSKCSFTRFTIFSHIIWVIGQCLELSILVDKKISMPIFGHTCVISDEWWGFLNEYLKPSYGSWVGGEFGNNAFPVFFVPVKVKVFAQITSCLTLLLNHI